MNYNLICSLTSNLLPVSAVCQAVASLGVGERSADRPGDTLQGVTPEGKKFLWANLQRIVEKRGRTGKKGVG